MISDHSKSTKILLIDGLSTGTSNLKRHKNNRLMNQKFNISCYKIFCGDSEICFFFLSFSIYKKILKIQK